MVRFVRHTTLVVAAGLCTMAILRADAGSKRDAERFKQKTDAIVAFGESKSKQTRRTTLTEQELNAFLTESEMPVGVTAPTVTIVGMGRVTAKAVVDLDAVRKSRGSRGFFDPGALLMGKLPVTAAGVLHATDGQARLELESATLAGLPIPIIVLQEIVSYYSRTPDNPNGIRLDEAFPLPSRIREIQVQRGQAIIIQ